MSLLTKYRPEELSDVIGQDAVVRALQRAIKTGASRCYLFTGPSGTGKTTLARIAANMVGCQEHDRQEIDAATKTGVDDMRSITELLMYRPIGEGAIKAVIIDECHMLTRQAWNSLLKIMEHPPDWVYWFLCTTEPGKVIKTVRTRSIALDLKMVDRKLIRELLDWVVREEKAKVPSEVITLCTNEAQGSPRQALANLGACLAARDRAEAAGLLKSAIEESAAVDLARALYRGAKWPELHRIVRELGEVNPESVRQVIRGYGTKIVESEKGERMNVSGPVLEVLDAFSEPFNTFDGMTQVWIACAKVALS